jgi:hypothetical protein
MGFRPFKYQYEIVERMMETNPALRWTDVIRRGIDLVIAELRGTTVAQSSETERTKIEQEARLQNEMQLLMKSIERLSQQAERFAARLSELAHNSDRGERFGKKQSPTLVRKVSSRKPN